MRSLEGTRGGTKVSRQLQPCTQIPARPRGAAWGSPSAGHQKVSWDSVSQLCPAGDSAGTWHLSGSRIAPGATGHDASSGLGALAPLPSPGPAPSRCSPMSSSALLM